MKRFFTTDFMMIVWFLAFFCGKSFSFPD